MKLILALLIASVVTCKADAQSILLLPTQKPTTLMLLKKEPVHHQMKPLMLTYRPRHLPFKLTIKPRTNKSVLSSINREALYDLDFDDAFDDVDFVGLGMFDVRLKFYVKKRARIILRALVRDKDPLFTIGFQFKA